MTSAETVRRCVRVSGTHILAQSRLRSVVLAKYSKSDVSHRCFFKSRVLWEKEKCLYFILHDSKIMFGLFQARLTKEQRWGSALLSRNHSLEEEFERAKAAVEVAFWFIFSVSCFWEWNSKSQTKRHKKWIFFKKLEDNCFTMFCWFLPFDNVNQHCES